MLEELVFSSFPWLELLRVIFVALEVTGGADDLTDDDIKLVGGRFLTYSLVYEVFPNVPKQMHNNVILMLLVITQKYE